LADRATELRPKYESGKLATMPLPILGQHVELNILREDRPGKRICTF
jgi:hypothetical protein